MPSKPHHVIRTFTTPTPAQHRDRQRVGGGEKSWWAAHRQAQRGGLEQRGQAGVGEAARQAQRQVQEGAPPRGRRVAALPHAIHRHLPRRRIVDDLHALARGVSQQHGRLDHAVAVRHL